MRQPATVNPTTPDAAKTANLQLATGSLHPVVRGALVNLDVKLEEELARYRRQKTTHRASPKSRTKSGELDLITVSAPIASISPALLAKLRPGVAQSLPSQPQPPVAAGSVAEPNHAADSVVGAASAQPEVAAAAVTSTADQATVASAAIANTEDLEDYLESSEELLRSLAVEEAQVRAERSFVHSLLTPIGVGSMLLLLLSSALFGYVVMNPTSLREVLSRLERKQSLPPVPETVPLATPPKANAPQPNLTEQEFKRLDLGSLATLKEDGVVAPPVAPPSQPPVLGVPSSANSTSSGVVAGVTAPVESTPPASAVKASSIPVTRIAPRGAAIAPEPAPRPITIPAKLKQKIRLPAARSPRPTRTTAFPATPAKAAAKSTPAAVMRSTPEGEKNRYKVVTEFQNDAALSTIKQNVPDAFVKNFPGGAKVQVGAYDNEIAARARVAELQKRGVKAEIQQR